MKFEILTDILFELLAKRKLTAKYIAERYGLSERTIYRYLDELSLAVPVQVQRGRNGGIFISDTYKLPVNFMTKEEYEAAIEALGAMYSQLPEERFLDAKRKLSAQAKSEARDLTLSSPASATARCWKSITTPASENARTEKSSRMYSSLSREFGTSMPFAEKRGTFGCSASDEWRPPS